MAFALLAPPALAASWSLQRTPNPANEDGSVLNGVSCSSGSACIAVGYYFFNGAVNQRMLAETWSGTRWKLERTPRARESVLWGVSCSSIDACTAVGGFETPTGEGVILAVRWNGTSWKLERAVTPAGTIGDQLVSVSCSAARSCLAVGSYDLNGNEVMLAERWNGTGWKRERLPSPAGTKSSALSGVSCSSPSACTAIGYASSLPSPAGGAVSLAERWNGTSWKLERIPSPARPTDASLTAVSCWSAKGCTAVGELGGSSIEPTLAERWNGTRWKVEPTPNRPGAEANQLQGVSCSSATACTATGWFLNHPSYEGTLAERWNGTRWTLQRTPNPAGGASSVMNDVSCWSASGCAAVGEFGNSTNGMDTLAEGYS